MIGLLLIYFIGKSFYSLAEQFNKSKWGFAVLAVAAFYASQFLLGILVGIYAELSGNYSLLENSIGLNLFGLLFAALCVTGLYYILKNAWSKKKRGKSANLLDDEFHDI